MTKWKAVRSAKEAGLDRMEFTYTGVAKVEFYLAGKRVKVQESSIPGRGIEVCIAVPDEVAEETPERGD